MIDNAKHDLDESMDTTETEVGEDTKADEQEEEAMETEVADQ